MRAILKLVIAAVSLPTVLLAQADAALSAIRVNDFIMIGRPANGTLLYGVDRDALSRTMHLLQDDPLFAVNQGRGLNVAIAFVNPLKVTWTVSQTMEADPLVASVERFLSSATTLLGNIGGAASAGAMGAVPANSTTKNVVPGSSDRSPTTPDARVPLFDPSLIEWTLWLRRGEVCSGTVQPAVQDLQAQGATLDQLLYQPSTSNEDGAEINSAGTFRNAVTAIIKTLKQASSFASLKTANDDAQNALGILEASTKSIRSDLEKLQGASKLIANAMVQDCGEFAEYTTSVFSSFKERADPTLKSRETLLADLRSVTKAINDKLSPTLPNDQEFIIGNVLVPSGKRMKVVVAITEHKFEFVDGRLVHEPSSTKTASFLVMERQSVVTEFSQGVAYSNIAFPRFNTNDPGTGHVVADAGSDKPRALIVGMLNFMPNTGWTGFTRLIGQVGIGATAEAPVLLAGGGIRFTAPAKFVLTFGAAFPFQKELKTFKIGSPVAGEAELKKDIQWHLAMRPALYIGIQR